MSVVNLFDDPILASPGAAPNRDVVVYEPSADDVDLDQAILDVVKKAGRDINVREMITGGEIERTMLGASTLRLDMYDRDYRLENSGVFDTAIDLRVDDYWF